MNTPRDSASTPTPAGSTTRSRPRRSTRNVPTSAAAGERAAALASELHRYHIDRWKVRGVDHQATVDEDDTMPSPPVPD